MYPTKENTERRLEMLNAQSEALLSELKNLNSKIELIESEKVLCLDLLKFYELDKQTYMRATNGKHKN